MSVCFSGVAARLWPAAGAVSSGSPAPRAPAAPPHSDWVSNDSRCSISSSFQSRSAPHTHSVSAKYYHLHWKVSLYADNTSTDWEETFVWSAPCQQQTPTATTDLLLRHFLYLNLPRNGWNYLFFAKHTKAIVVYEEYTIANTIFK